MKLTSNEELEESKSYGYSPDTSFHTSTLDSLKDFYFVVNLTLDSK